MYRHGNRTGVDAPEKGGDAVQSRAAYHQHPLTGGTVLLQPRCDRSCLVFQLAIGQLGAVYPIAVVGEAERHLVVVKASPFLQQIHQSQRGHLLSRLVRWGRRLPRRQVPTRTERAGR